MLISITNEPTTRSNSIKFNQIHTVIHIPGVIETKNRIVITAKNKANCTQNTCWAATKESLKYNRIKQSEKCFFFLNSVLSINLSDYWFNSPSAGTPPTIWDSTSLECLSNIASPISLIKTGVCRIAIIDSGVSLISESWDTASL